MNVDENQIIKISFLLIIISGLVQGLTLFDINIVTTLFGVDTFFSQAIYAVFGASALAIGYYKWVKKKRILL